MSSLVHNSLCSMGSMFSVSSVLFLICRGFILSKRFSPLPPFIENRSFFYGIYPNYSVSSLHSFQLFSSTSKRSTPFLSLFHKKTSRLLQDNIFPFGLICNRIVGGLYHAQLFLTSQVLKNIYPSRIIALLTGMIGNTNLLFNEFRYFLNRSSTYFTIH